MASTAGPVYLARAVPASTRFCRRALRASARHPARLLALGCALSCGSAAAQAPELTATAALAVAKDPSGRRAAAAAAAVLQAAVVADPGLRWIEPAVALGEQAPAPAPGGSQAQARAALQRGRQAYDALQLAEAIQQLQAAVDGFSAGAPADRQGLQESLRYLGEAQVLSGADAAGQRSFSALLRLNPQAQLDGAPPAAQACFARAAAAQPLAGPGGGGEAKLEVYSAPPYAAVFIDGRFQGVSPLPSLRLSPGPHQLRLDKLGYASKTQRLRLRAGRTTTSQQRLRSLQRGAELRELAARAAAEPRHPQVGPSLRHLSRTLGASQLIFVTVSQSGDEVSLRGQLCRGGVSLGEAVAVLSARSSGFQLGLERFAQRLLELGRRPAPAAQALGAQTTQDHGLSWDQAAAQRPPPRRWPGYVGWGLVGVGGAALVNGAVFGVLTAKTHKDYGQTAQGSARLRDLRDRGKNQAKIADISYLAGGICLLSGGAILWLVDDHDDPPGLLEAGLAPTAGGAYLSLQGSF